MLHPANLLFVWGCLLLLLQKLPLHSLLPIALIVVGMAFVLSGMLFRLMLRRTRWLFLTLVVLFVVMTPGVLVPAPLNFGFITRDGLLAALEHVSRLAAMLSLLALLLDKMDQRAIIAGLYVLLRPLVVIGIDRERVSVRLLLVFDYMASDRIDWGQLSPLESTAFDTNRLILPTIPLRARDALMVGLAVLLTAYAWVHW